MGNQESRANSTPTTAAHSNSAASDRSPHTHKVWSVTHSPAAVLIIHVNDYEFDIKELFDHGDPYLIFTVGLDSYRTKILPTGHKKSFSVRIPLSNEQKEMLMKVSLYDHDVLSKDDYQGSAEVSIQVLKQHQGSPFTFEFIDKKSKSKGRLSSKIEFFEKEFPREVIRGFWSTAFHAFDEDGNDQLSLAEFECLLEAVGSQIGSEEAAKLFKKADKDGSDTLTLTELVDALCQTAEESHLYVTRNPFTESEHVNTFEGMINIMMIALSENLSQFIVGHYLSEDVARRGKFSSFSGSATEDTGYVHCMNRKTKRVEVEVIPTYIKMAMRAMYSTALIKAGVDASRAKKVLNKMTVSCRSKYDHPDSRKDIKPFIKLHNLDPADFEIEDISQFKNFNEFFYRKLKPSVRPLFQPENDEYAVSPADCRCVVFPHIAHSTAFWIKGSNFTVQNLLQDTELSKLFEDGSLVISRLAPQDYHRFHSPVSGKIEFRNDIPGEFYTVNPIAIRQPFDVYTENRRRVVLIQSPTFGKVAYVIIGATMVGSMVVTLQNDAHIKKGDEIGYFAFGGSTIITIFERNRIVFDDDLLENSRKPLETLILVKDGLGRAKH